VYTKTIINVCNDFMIGKSHYYNKLNDFDNYFIKPYPSINDQVMIQLNKLFGTDYTQVQFYDFANHFIDKLRNIILNNPENIITDQISEKDEDGNYYLNYGAVRNLNCEFFPTDYIYQYIIAYSKTYDDNGNVIEGDPDGITIHNMISFDDTFNLNDYVRKFIKVVLVPFFNSIDILKDKYVYDYNEHTKYITTFVENFYMRFFKEVFEQYFNKPDNFYKAVIMLRDYLIPYLFNDIITFIKTYGMNYFTKSILARVSLDPVKLSIDFEDYNLIEDTYYRTYHRFRYLHNVKNRSQFPIIVLWNSFLLPSDFYNNASMLNDGFQSLFFIKYVNSENETFLNTNTEISLEGFSTYSWKVYNYNRTFELFFKVNENYVIDEEQVNFDTLSRIIKSTYDNQLNKMNVIQKMPTIGIINYNYTENKNESFIYVTDELNKVQELLNKSNPVICEYSYIMNDVQTKDSLKNYIDENNFSRNLYLYIDIDTLNLDLTNQDDINYIKSLQKHNIQLCVIGSFDYICNYQNYMLLKNIFNRLCIRITEEFVLYKMKKENIYQVDAYIDKSIVSNHGIETYFLFKKYIKQLLGVQYVYSHY